MLTKKILNRKAWLLLIAGGASLALQQRGVAQADPDGPTALIVSYRSRPEMRAKFRAVMQADEVATLEKWKKLGVFTSYQMLFTAYAGTDTPDMFLVLRFAHFTDLGRWQKLEETYPGGLVPAAQALGEAQDSATADIVKEATKAATTSASQFFVLQYDVLVDMPKYVSYVSGYVTPQFDGWEKTGALSSYAAYVNQNPAGAPWSSFIVLEYKDLQALAMREVIKNKVRAELAQTNPVWKKWSDDKSAIRKEKAAIPARSLKSLR